METALKCIRTSRDHFGMTAWRRMQESPATPWSRLLLQGS